VDGKVKTWDIRKASSLVRCLDQHNSAQEADAETNQAHEGPVNGLTFTHDGATLVSAGNDQKICLWDARQGRNMLVNFGPRIRNQRQHAIQMAVASPDVGAGVGVGVLFFPNDDNRVLALDMRDGSTELYTGGGDSEVLIWRPARLERISELQEKASTPAASGLEPPRLSCADTANRRGFPA
ncbi:hypothetical protein EV182_006851, partial [Spiromyces aspiralis]